LLEGKQRSAPSVCPSQAASNVEAARVEPRTKPGPRWCPPGLTKTQCHRVQKLRASEIREKEKEAARDQWFNQERPMTMPAKTWKEKWIEKEERDGESSDESESDETGQRSLEINMVIHLLGEFELPEREVAWLDLSTKRAIFEKPEEIWGGAHETFIH
jgi:hypothetical protein